MPQTYDVPSGAETQSAVSDNSTVTTVTPPYSRANGMLISVVTTDVWITFGQGTPSASLGHVVKKDVQPLYLPFARAFKWLPTSNAAAKVNITWLYG